MSSLTEQITLNDVQRVVQCFYDKARTNQEIGHFFNHISDFTEHEKKIAAFWWLALGGRVDDLPGPAPSFDMIKKHLALGIADADLEIWLSLFKQTLTEQLDETCASGWSNKLDEIARQLKALVIDGRSYGLQIQQPGNS